MSRGRQRHRLSRDVDYEALKHTLSARLRRPVELLATPPQDGGDGELVVCCAKTDEPLKVDPAVVQALLATATDRPDPRSIEQIALDELDAAGTDDEKITAIRGYLQRLVDTENTRLEALRQRPPNSLESLFDVFAHPGPASDEPAEPISEFRRHQQLHPYPGHQPPLRQSRQLRP